MKSPVEVPIEKLIRSHLKRSKIKGYVIFIAPLKKGSSAALSGGQLYKFKSVEEMDDFLNSGTAKAGQAFLDQEIKMHVFYNGDPVKFDIVKDTVANEKEAKIL